MALETRWLAFFYRKLVENSAAETSVFRRLLL